jgi:hypothetical protein
VGNESAIGWRAADQLLRSGVCVGNEPSGLFGIFGRHEDPATLRQLPLGLEPTRVVRETLAVIPLASSMQTMSRASVVDDVHATASVRPDTRPACGIRGLSASRD